jgi:nuclear migration protein JNM1
LLPQIQRLNSQITLLSQPRHIDSISRRLKLLLSDLDRVAAAQHSHRRQSSQPDAITHTQLQEQLLPLLSRLGPSIPQIPHILTRLRTLSSLHTAAGEFQNVLEGLEEEQRKLKENLTELEGAVGRVEKAMEENSDVVKKNTEGLEKRLEEVSSRLIDLKVA